MTLRSLFARDVTRAIPPVVYFHEQDPARLQSEVDEYIVTGGYPPGHPNQKRVPVGIHEQYVALLRGIVAELDSGASLPTAWVSGFYGSGKSSFAKLIGLALDRHPVVALPDGRTLAAALLARDQSPKSADLEHAFDALLERVSPLSVVFDVGGSARDHEHIHAVAVRQVQRRLGYSQSDPHVADFELRLEQDGEHAGFLATAQAVLGKPWDALKHKRLAEEDFSLVLHHLYPQRYPDPTAWYASRGAARRDLSPQEACIAIRDMLAYRAPDATLFLVVDEVSQYVIGHSDRIDRLRAFATELGSALKGKVWLIALGQQKLDEQADPHRLGWMKDRFPPKLQLHLAPTNIRDVIHRRLLTKTEAGQAELRALFAAHRPSLQLYAYDAAELTPDDFVEVYPLLPNHIDLLLQVTSALRQRTSRAQGDDHGIRGVLQLLGELFRAQGLADAPIGTLVTFDRVYEVIHTALDSDLQASMARVLAQTVNADPLLLQCAKVVALLEHIQETLPTSAELVAQCVYDRVDRGDRVAEVRAALEALRQKNLLGYGEKTGYKIQSSSAEEWEQERSRVGVSREQRAELVKAALVVLSEAALPKLGKRDFRWKVTFATRLVDDGEVLKELRDQAAMAVDFRWLVRDESDEAKWIKRSDEATLASRLVWVGGDETEVTRVASELGRSRDMVARYRPRRDSLVVAKKNLLNHEEARAEDLQTALQKAVAEQFVAGRLYFAGRPIDPREHGQTVGVILTAAANRLLPEIYKYFESVDVQPSHIKQLLEEQVSGLTTQLMSGPLQLFDLEAGRYVATANGTIPTRILAEVQKQSGMSGSALFSHFAGPPFAWTNYMVQAAIAGLVRAQKLEIRTEDGVKVTHIRDMGVRDIFEKERAFRAAQFFVANAPIDPRLRARIAHLLEAGLDIRVEREDHHIVNAVGLHMPRVVRRTKDMLARHARVPERDLLPLDPQVREVRALAESAESLASLARITEDAMQGLQKDLDVLRDGFHALKTLESELTEERVQALRDARRVTRSQGAQLTRLPSHASGPVAAAVVVIDQALATTRPWLDVEAVRSATRVIVEAYAAERLECINWQAEQLDRAKEQMRIEPRFVVLGDDAKNDIMRRLTSLPLGTLDALEPELLALREPFARVVGEALDAALDALDDAEREAQAARVQRERAAGRTVTVVEQPTVLIDLRLARRVLSNEGEVDALLAEVRDTLMDEIRAGRRVRLK